MRSQEVSQLFSECILVWCVSVWSLLGCPPALKLIELGPVSSIATRVPFYLTIATTTTTGERNSNEGDPLQSC